MLKGRSKAFAPKKVGPRKLAAPSVSTSAPPSVERQSQTPAPSQQSQNDLPSITRKDSEANFASNKNVDYSAAQDSVQVAADLQESANTVGRSQLKRKDREDDSAAKSAPKRSAVRLTRPNDTVTEVESTQDIPSVVSVAESPATNQIPAATTQITNTTAPPSRERKDRETELSTPPAERVFPDPQSLHGPTSHPTSVAKTAAPNHHNATTPAQASTTQPEAPAPSENAANNASDTTNTQNIIIEKPSTSAGESRGRSKSPSTNARAMRHHRYPSPENMVRLADEMPRVSASATIGQSRNNGDVLHPSQVVTMASLNPDGTSGGMVEESASGTEKGKKKAKGKVITRGRKIQATADGDDDRPTVGMQLNRQRRITGERRPRKRTEPRERQPRPRAVTPDGASDEEIDHRAVTMADLCKDLKIGKKSSRHDEIMRMIAKRKQDAAATKFRRDHPELVAAATSTPEEGHTNIEAEAPANGEASGSNDREESPEPRRTFVSGPRMRIVGGNMVLDETSTVIDRQKNAAREREVMEVIEETDFSRLVTQGTHMKREKNQQWDGAAMELFYKGLRMFGTDFQMIAGMFPHRSRRQIKLKFNKEERDNPAKINRALTGEKDPIDLDEWQKIGDRKLEDLAVIQAEQAKVDAEQQEEVARYAEAAAEAVRKKKESIKGSEAARRLLAGMASDEENDGDEDGLGESSKENQPRGRSRGRGKTAVARRRKNIVEDNNFEIVGTID